MHEAVSNGRRRVSVRRDFVNYSRFQFLFLVRETYTLIRGLLVVIGKSMTRRDYDLHLFLHPLFSSQLDNNFDERHESNLKFLGSSDPPSRTYLLTQNYEVSFSFCSKERIR